MARREEGAYKLLCNRRATTPAGMHPRRNTKVISAQALSEPGGGLCFRALAGGRVHVGARNIMRVVLYARTSAACEQTPAMQLDELRQVTRQQG